MNGTFKPAEIAKQCGVTTNSIRNWSREFRLHLSEGANAPERYYNTRDLSVLKYISSLKAEGMKPYEIAERLAETSFGEVETFNGHELATQTALDSSQSAPAQLIAPEYISRVERRFEALEAAREADKVTIETLQYRTITAFAFGFIAAGIFFLILVVLAWLYSTP